MIQGRFDDNASSFWQLYDVQAFFMKTIWLCSLTLVAGVLGMFQPAQALVFGINEGVTYRVTPSEIRARYTWIAADLSAILQQPVTIQPITDYQDLRQGLAAHHYDLALVHPAHISIQALRDWGYKLVVIAKGFQNYTAHFLIKSDSPLKSLAQLRGAKMSVPDEDSITAWMVRATLRDQGISTEQLHIYYTRYQDTVPLFVSSDLTQAGASAAPDVIGSWTAQGGAVLDKSRPVPIKHIIASTALSPRQVENVREYFSALDQTNNGRKKLALTHLKGFEPYDASALLALGNWLGIPKK